MATFSETRKRTTAASSPRRGSLGLPCPQPGSPSLWATTSCKSPGATTFNVYAKKQTQKAHSFMHTTVDSEGWPSRVLLWPLGTQSTEQTCDGESEGRWSGKPPSPSSGSLSQPEAREEPGDNQEKCSQQRGRKCKGPGAGARGQGPPERCAAALPAPDSNPSARRNSTLGSAEGASERSWPGGMACWGQQWLSGRRCQEPRQGWEGQQGAGDAWHGAGGQSGLQEAAKGRGLFTQCGGGFYKASRRGRGPHCQSSGQWCFLERTKGHRQACLRSAWEIMWAMGAGGVQG